MKSMSTSLFHQVLNVIPKHEFEEIIINHKVDKHKQNFGYWSHFVSMIFCQRAQANSFREICGGLKTCGGKLNHLGMEAALLKSNLSYANKHHDPVIFKKVFFMLLDHCKAITPRDRFYFDKKLHSLDATLIKLCVKSFSWATYRKTKGAIRLHLLLDHDGYLPVFLDFTEDSVNKINSTRKMELPRDSMIACDREYIDFDMLYDWKKTAFSLSNATYDVPKHDRKQYDGNVLSDEVIFLRGARINIRNTCEKWWLAMSRITKP